MSKLQEIKVPDIGTDSKVDVIEILVKVGDKIQIEDPIVTLESDKASMDVPASHAGIVKAIKIKVGDKIGEGDLVLTLEADASTSDAATAEKSEENNKSHNSEVAQKASDNAVSQTIYFPDLGTDSSVDVVELLVSNGDELTTDTAIVTLEGDKASMDVPSSVNGKLEKLYIKVGDKVKTGDKLAQVLASDEKAKTPSSESAPKAAEPQAEETKHSTRQVEEAVSEATDNTDLYAGPAVRRLARELGVNLSQISGTGRKGRIQLSDVHGYVKPIMQQAQGGQAMNGSGFSLPAAPEVDHSKYGEIETKELSKIQKISGKNLQRNWIVVPHVTQFDEADITELEAFRKQQNAAYKAKGVKITPLAFIMKAAVAALKAFPHFNASLAPEGDKLILKKYFHIGVAVDTPNGLVVAVIRDVDQKGILEISQELATVSEKARTKGLSLNEMQGSSFTISSLGGIGGTAFTPIVNMPDVAILGVSKSQIKPVYQNETFVPRLMLPLSLSYDHRVIDGADGARFSRLLSETLSDIRQLIL
ncbi:MAG: dihydrolipoyllysine-residue acetyltransferase [Legionellales bacterium]|nr:dihydrolipoyllysine-residue acetyltransferase [Legionellales bacterium]